MNAKIEIKQIKRDEPKKDDKNSKINISDNNFFINFL